MQCLKAADFQRPKSAFPNLIPFIYVRLQLGSFWELKSKLNKTKLDESNWKQVRWSHTPFCYSLQYTFIVWVYLFFFKKKKSYIRAQVIPHVWSHFSCPSEIAREAFSVWYGAAEPSWGLFQTTIWWLTSKVYYKVFLEILPRTS